MSDFWGSILSALGIGGDAAQQQPPPPSGGQGLLGATQPQIPSWDQYNKDRSSFGGILSGMLSHGIGPGLGAAIAPDSEAMQTYNAGLGQGQAVGIQGIGIPRQQFMSDVIAGKRDGDTGKWLGPGPDPMAQQQQPSYAPQAPQIPGQGTPVTGASLLPPQGGAGGGSAPAGPNLLAPPGSRSPPDDTATPGAAGAPGVVSGNGHPTFMGLPLPRGVTPSAARMSLAIDPTGKGLLDIVKQGLTMTNVRPGGAAVDSYGNPIYQQPVLPQGQVYQGGQAVTVPGANQQHATLQGIDQGAIENREQANARQAYTLKTGQPAPSTAGGPLSTGGPAMPAPAPQPAASSPSASPQNAGMKGEDFQTDRGTVVPSVRGQTIKQGEIQYKNQADASQKTEENWNAIGTQIPTTRARVLSTAKILAQTQAGGLSEAKAEASQKLSGMGLDWLANKVMSAKDRAGVQTILWNSMQESLAYLKTANAGTGGRILNSEFNAFLEHGYSPDMEPQALREGMTQLLGGSYQTGNMIEDWHGPAQKMNWQDANQFQSQYLRKNPLESFITYADKEMPKFRGEQSASPATAAPAAKGAASPSEGDTAINRETGERLVLKGGQWVPLK